MRPLAIISLLVVSWVALAAAAMGTGRIVTAAVPFPREGFLANLPDGVAVIGRTDSAILLRSDDPDYVRALYAAGARIVLPARRKTCLALQPG